MAALCLFAILACLAFWVVRDIRQYRLFKATTDSIVRQRYYLSWTVQSFVLLVGLSAITAAVLGRDLPLLTLPPEFRELAAASSPPDQGSDSEEGRFGMAIGFALGLGIAVAVHVWRMRRAMTAMLGDVDSMIPRNRREILAALPLCLNAGFSEELFFRLALPLLIASVTGSVLIGLAASAVIFGLIHLYQGWKGVIATMVAGVVLTVIYLQSGSLIRPMLLHALMDVLALVVRPALSARFGAAGRGSAARLTRCDAAVGRP